MISLITLKLRFLHNLGSHHLLTTNVPMSKFHPFPDSARCFLALSRAISQCLLACPLARTKVISSYHFSHTEWVPSNVAFLNPPFLSHCDCQEEFWAASTLSNPRWAWQEPPGALPGTKGPHLHSPLSWLFLPKCSMPGFWSWEMSFTKLCLGGVSINPSHPSWNIS